MSDFSYLSFGTYSITPGGLIQTSSTLTPGTLADGDNDDQFESGDTISSPVSASYTGVADVGGTLYPYFTNGITAYVFFDDATTPPATIALADLSSASFGFCFAKGTLVATPKGAIAVEALSIGDLIVAADGKEIPVKWIGRQTVFPSVARADQSVVQISKGALGDGFPLRDLFVTAEHGMILDGVIANAGALVNGASIRFVPAADLPERLTVYHIETEGHQSILAEGAEAETFVDYAARKAFDNHAEYETLYGAEPLRQEMDMPRIATAKHLPASLKARLGIDVSASDVETRVA